ncbi:WD40-repeat-containing domain protein [Xylaria scruposa]|nr:WD40-repeat-containing domain protein [Xylaria scruposa]
MFKKVKEKFRQHRTASAAQPTTSSTDVLQKDSLQHEPNVPLIAATKPHAHPSLLVADHQTTQPSTQSRPADQDQSIAASQVLCLAVPVEPLARPALAGPMKSSNPTISVSEELWNTAFNNLEADEAELVGSYVKILNEVLGGESGETATNLPDNQIERQQNMMELVKRGLERVEKASKITTKVGSIAGFILSSKGIVDLTIQAVPQAAPAALPWAGVCLGLEILRNPDQEMNSNLEGIAYVISRMDWYCALTELLLNKSNFVDGNNFQAVLSQLKKMIIELYKALLSYQMKSIVSYYRKQSVRFFRDMGKLDDWKGNIQHVKDVETAVREFMDQYYQEQTKADLNKLSENAYTLTVQLGNIQKDIRSFIMEQKAASREKDDSECRRELRVVDPQDDMTRIENNKDPLLDDAYKWIFETPEYKKFINWENGGPDSPQRQVLWLKGHAGTGKTMLMIGLIRELSNHPVALAPGISFFFCQGTNSEFRTATAVLRSLIWLLLLQQPHLISHLLPKYKISGPSLFTDLNSFVALSEVFKNMLKDDQLSPVYLAVDALDECSEGRADLITLILTTLTLSKNVKWLLSSRPEVDVLSEHRTAETLIELDTQRLERPVKAYIEHKLNILKVERRYNDRVLNEISDIVQQKANNTFLWVALAFKALGKRNAAHAVKIMLEMPPGLSDLYEHMMGRIDKSERSDPSDCKKVLRAVFLVTRPLSISELSTLIGLESDIIQDAVEECGSFVTVNDEIVNMIHQSAKDYLKDKYDPKRDPDWVALGHADLIEHSLGAISSLEQNIYGLDPDTNPKNMTPPDRDPLAGLRYSCVFWMEHLAPSKREQPDSFKDLMTIVHEFLKTGFLRWLESLSLLGKVEDGMRALRELVRLIEAEPDVDSSLVEFSKDAYLFFSSNISIIQQAPLQTYGSALVFSPTMSMVGKQYWEERQPLVVRKLGFKDHWTRHQTLEGHTGKVAAVAFSPDGKSLASASADKEVRLHDAATGAHRQTLQVQECSRIESIAFSPSGETLAIAVSGSQDHVQLWDMATSVCRLTLTGHTGQVNAVAFSPDGNTLASGLEDDRLWLWNLASTPSHRAFKRHTDSISTIAFAPNGTLVSGSRDGTIVLWDLAKDMRLQTIEPQQGSIWAVAVSPDGNTLASGGDGALSLWNMADGALIQSLEGHKDQVNSVVFSPDGMTLAASGDKAVRLWDLTSTPLSCKTFEGHTDIVTTVAFSPNGKMLASASYDQTVWLWDTTAPSASSEMREERTLAVAISPSGKILASISRPSLLRLWDVATIQPDSKAIAECDIDPSLTRRNKYPYLGDYAFSPNGRMIALAWPTGVQLWDVATTPITSRTLGVEGTSKLIFSPDSKMLAIKTFYGTLHIWDLTTAPPEPGEILTKRVYKMVFSPDSKKFAAATFGETVYLWDLTTVPPESREILTKRVDQIVFSPDSQKLAAAASNDTVYLWDLTIVPPESREILIGRVDKILFSLDSQILETTSKMDAMVQQWDVATGSRFSSDHHQNGDFGYSVSADDSWITLNGKHLLWLPLEYRPEEKPAIHGSTVAIATKTETLAVMEFL